MLGPDVQQDLHGATQEQQDVTLAQSSLLQLGLYPLGKWGLCDPQARVLGPAVLGLRTGRGRSRCSQSH